jgi:LPXTG-motif cell wall-anchored protein
MKKIIAVVALSATALIIAPQHAHAGLIRFATVSCSTGVDLTWADPHNIDGDLQNPPIDVYTMVIESVTANGVPVPVRTVDGLRAVMDPITATGVVTIKVQVHWHIERPNGTSTDSPTVERQGTVSCNDPVPTTAAATTLPDSTAVPATTVIVTTSSVASGGPTVTSSVAGGPTTTRVSTDITLPETGGDATRSTVLATVFLILGGGAFAASRRRVRA